MSDLNKLTLSKARDLLINGDISAVSLTENYLSKIESGRKLNSFCLITAETALAKAKQCDELMKLPQKGKLCGIPLAVKDIFCTKSKPTQAASKILTGFIP